MNAYTFANSRAAGFAVVWIVMCAVMVVLIVAALWLERRDRMAREARVRLARASRDARVRTFPAGASMRVLRPQNGRVADRTSEAFRARLLGVDELDPGDDFAGYAEYGGALRQ